VPESLDQLLERVGRREESAVAGLVERFSPAALRLAAALLGDTHEAEEAVQEAFVEALNRLGDLRSIEAFPAWFRQVVRTRANRRLRRPHVQPCSPVPEPPSSGPTPLESAEQGELHAQVRAALARLPAAGRETAERFYLDGWSIAKLAAAMEVPAGTVKRRLYDARAKPPQHGRGYCPAAKDGYRISRGSPRSP
jgi:RNA polymerase sigma factor (sigma-70 family)